MSRRLEATRRPPLKAIRRAVANTEVVPQQAARHLLIAGCGLDHAPKRASRASVLRIIRQLGFVQVDSISSVERAHHLILHARLDGYVPEMLGLVAKDGVPPELVFNIALLAVASAPITLAEEA